MAEDNIILHFSDENKKRQLFVKKIKLENFPELLKDYNDFFNNQINYFNNNYKNNLIVVGKIQNNKEKDELISKLKNPKSKNKKYFFNSSRISTSRLISEEASHENKKRIPGKILKDNSLKAGQQYIDDYQLDDLFNKFKIVKNINKSRTKNFVTVKDLIEKKFKINPLKTEKNAQSVKFKENNEYNNTMSTCISNPNIKNENLNQSNSSKNFLNNFNHNFGFFSHKNIFNKHLNKDYKKNKYATISNFYINDKINLKKKNIRTRNKMINNQKQFLLTNKEKKYYINESEKKYFAEILANQEEVLLKSSKSETKLDYISNIILKKNKKCKKDLLIQNTEDYRIKYELLSRIDKCNQLLGPEHYYDWYQDLRTIPNQNSIKGKILSNIRNPLFNRKKINLFKNIRIKNLKRLVNSVNKTSHNLKGLMVKGQDLWQLENDFVKSLKNKKIINNFESYLPTTDVEDKYFCIKNTHFNKN